MKLVGKGRSVFDLTKVDNSTVRVFFSSDFPAGFKDKELNQKIKSPEGVSFKVEVPVYKILELYLRVKTFENSFSEVSDFIALSSDDDKKVVKVFKHLSNPNNLCLLGIDYNEKKAGIVYLNHTIYRFVLFTTYLQTFLQNFPVLSYKVASIEFTYNREEQLLTVLDADFDKFHYIERDELNVMKQILDNYYQKNILFTHSFTPDRNIFIDKDEVFYVNDKRFDLTLFKQIVYMIQI